MDSNNFNFNLGDLAGIFGHTDPRGKSGVLQFSQNRYDPHAKTIIFTFTATKSWRGNPPFAWRYLPPTGKRHYPIIEIFTARNVCIKIEDKIKHRGPVGPTIPVIRVYRPQHIHAFPDQIDLSRILTRPYYSSPLPQKLHLPSGEIIDNSHLVALRSVRVEPIPNGVRIVNTEGWYSIQITVPSLQYGAFWYSLPFEGKSTGDLKKLLVCIIHTDNVDINAEGLLDKRLNVLIYTCKVKVQDWKLVPWQGEEINWSESLKDKYKKKGSHKIIELLRSKYGRKGVYRYFNPKRGKGWWKDSLASIVEAVVSPIPILGDVYDFANFVYAGATGEDFFGREVNRTELIVLGLAVAIPLGLNTRGAFQNFAKKHKASGLDNLSNEEALNLLEEKLAPELKEALENLSSAEKKELLRHSDEALESSSQVKQDESLGPPEKKATNKQTLEEFFDKFLETTGKPYTAARANTLLREIEAGRIPNDFLEDLSGFNNSVLQKAYNDYLGAVRKRSLEAGHHIQPVDVITWATRRKNEGKLGRELEGLYGRRWKSKLQSLIAVRNRLQLTATEKSSIEKLFTKGLRNFNEGDLKTEYAKYRASTKDKPPMRALDWAISRKGKKIREIFEKELGSDWQLTLKALRGDYIVREVPPWAREHFERMWSSKLGIKDYFCLKEQNKFFGMFYEVDHIFEQRFWRNNPWIDSFDQLEEGAAIVIPKNARILDLMGEKYRNFSYSHQEKTRLLNELIPAGHETRYSLQQIYDAHVYVYKKLGAPKEVYGENLKEMFKIYQEIVENLDLPKYYTHIDFDKKIDISQFTIEKWRPVELFQSVTSTAN